MLQSDARQRRIARLLRYSTKHKAYDSRADRYWCASNRTFVSVIFGIQISKSGDSEILKAFKMHRTVNFDAFSWLRLSFFSAYDYLCLMKLLVKYKVITLIYTLINIRVKFKWGAFSRGIYNRSTQNNTQSFINKEVTIKKFHFSQNTFHKHEWQRAKKFIYFNIYF